MAGLGPLDAMYQTFLGQTNDALNSPAAPWQQELMETVNPEKVKRQNIKLALAQAMQTLATTPGNFLTGMSAAAGAGANSYLQAQQDAEQQRTKAMQLVQLAQQKDQDRRLSLLMDAIGVNRNIESDVRDKEYNDARVAYYRNGGSRRGTDSDTGLTEYQTSVRKKDILDGIRRKKIELYQRRKDGEEISEQQYQQELADEQHKLEQIFGIPLYGQEDRTAQADRYTEQDAGNDGQNITQFDLMTGGNKVNIPKRQNAGSSTQSLSPPPQAIQLLRENPQYKVQFDAKYGEGAADRYLGN